MASREPVSARFDVSDAQAIEDHGRRLGAEDRSDAFRRLALIGLRETKYPVIYRLKTHLADWIGQMLLAAVLVVVAGYTTEVFAFERAVSFAVVIVAVAVASLGVFEVVRLVAGQNRLGVQLRSLYGGERV